MARARLVHCNDDEAAARIAALGRAGYSGTPLAKKLGIKAGMRIALLDAPEGLLDTLGPLPEGVELRGDARARRELTLWFLTRTRQLSRRIERLAAQVGDGGLWICWPKKSSPLWIEVTETHVRAEGLAHGLVDYKVCAIDADWSGLKFARRKGNKK